MLTYILQTIAFQLVFLLIYDVFLKRETFFNWNRVYLLVTAISSVILPFIKIERFKEAVPQQFIMRLPEVVIGEVSAPAPTTLQMHAVQTVEPIFVWHWSMLIYVGMAIATLLLIYKAIKISMVIYKNPKRWKGDLLLVNLLKSNAAFSIFHYICIGEQIRDEDKKTIFKHEVVHVQQKHTLDLLLFELLRIVFWFNPLVYMYQNRMSALHEYIADAQAVKNDNKTQYYENLLSQVFDVKQFSFINPFFKQSLIKKRIVMLSKSKSNRIHLLKYALLFPMVFGMLLYTSSYAQETNVSVENVSNDESANQEQTLQELIDKYYKEIEELEKSKVSSSEIFQKSRPNKDNYIWSKAELAKLKAYVKYLENRIIKDKSEERTLTIEDQERFKKMVNTHQTYEDYLKYMKTGEAKRGWENQARDGVVRLVVDDFKNLTTDEKKLQKEKIDLILNDAYYHTLVTTSVNGGGSIMTFDKPTSVEEAKMVDTYDIEVPFGVIEEVPTFEECQTLLTNEEKKKCTSDIISRYINGNFNTKLAKDLGLSGKQRINVIFKIDKQGNVSNVMARAPHPELEKEAKRVVASLPKMIPGKQKGKPVTVPYSLPILFVVNGDSPLIEKVNAVKEQIEKQGNATDEENEGLNVLYKIVSSEKFDSELVSTTQKFIDKKGKSTLSQKIADVMDQIQTQGTISDAEEKALKLLLIYTIEGAFTNPYFKDVLGLVEIPFAITDEVPTFEECKQLPTNKERKDCTSQTIANHVNKKFNTKVAKEHNLKGKQRITVVFVIAADGSIKDAKARASHPVLEAEAIRVINALPKMIPGKFQGVIVNVPYSLPIIFQIQ